jgi:hypothetical protein
VQGGRALERIKAFLLVYEKRGEEREREERHEKTINGEYFHYVEMRIS